MATIDLSWTNTTTGGTTNGFKIWRWAGTLATANDDAYVIANGDPVKDGTEALSTFTNPQGEDYTYADTGLASATTYNYVLQAKNDTGASPSATATDTDSGTVATVVVA